MVSILHEVIHYGIAFKREDVKIEVQIFLLAFVKQRIPTLHFLQHLRHLHPRVRANSRLMNYDSVGEHLIDEVIDTGIIDRHRDILRIYCQG